MTKYTVIEPFKDETGRHRPGDVLDSVDHADALISAGLIHPEPETEPQEPEKKTPENKDDAPSAEPEAESQEQQEEKTENKPQPAVPLKKEPSKKTGGKNK
nr:MAG TPA: hypothetical protein [Caudoviricetes sp.]